MRYFAFLILTFFFLTSEAQEGDFFVTNFTPHTRNIDHLYFDLEFSSKEELIAANKAGVLKFDGTDWDLIATPSAVLDLVLDQEDKIYVACADDFGQIDIIDGSMKFHSLKDDETEGLTQQVLLFDNRVFFLQADQLIEYLPGDDSLRYFQLEEEVLEEAFEFERELYINGIDTLRKFEENLVPTSSFLPEGKQVSICSKSQFANEYAVTSVEGQVYFYDGIFQEKTVPEDVLLTDISWSSSNHFVLATYASGLVVFDLEADEILGRISAGKGLPDNEIYAISSDHRNGVWIANSFGFSRVAPEIRIKSFNYFPGLEGNLISALPIEDSWLMATSSGVFYFDEEQKFKNSIYYVPRTASKRTTTPRSNSASSKKASSNKKEKNSLTLKKVFNNVKTSLTPTSSSKSRTLGQKKPGVLNRNKDGFINKLIKGEPTTQYVRRTKRELVSTEFLYKRFEGLSEKSKQLILFGDKYLVSTPSGIVEIADKIATEIYDQPSRLLHHHEPTNQLVVSTLEGGLKFLELNREIWVESDEIEIQGDAILAIQTDSDNRLWAAGAVGLYEIEVTDSVSSVINRYALENQYFDNIKITELADKIYLINTLGYFFLDEAKGELVRDEEIEKIGIATRHLQQRDGIVWINNGEDWFRLNRDKSTTQFTYLKLFPEMSQVDQVGEALWIIDNNEKFYRYTPDQMDSIPSTEMYFKEVRSKQGLLPTHVQNLQFEYENNSVHFELARPDYLGLLDIEYTHKLEGHGDKWSSWTKNNHIDFAYLPPGEYVLRVKSRDTFGREQEGRVIPISIRPPYWETMWFNVSEVLFFAILVLASARLNRTGNKKYSLVTSILTIVTVVMIIESLQNIAGSYLGNVGTPVLALGIDVGVAILVFPIEQLLRKFVEGKPVKELIPVGKKS